MEFLLLGFLAVWEGARYVRGLTAIASPRLEPAKVFHMATGTAFCAGALLVGIAGQYPVLKLPGLILCGIALVCAMWMPCSVPAVNRLALLKAFRNMVFLGVAFILLRHAFIRW